MDPIKTFTNLTDTQNQDPDLVIKRIQFAHLVLGVLASALVWSPLFGMVAPQHLQTTILTCALANVGIVVLLFINANMRIKVQSKRKAAAADEAKQASVDEASKGT